MERLTFSEASPVPDTYSKGADAYHAGVSREANPYPAGSQEREEWDEAWDTCKAYDDPDVQRAIQEMMGVPSQIITCPDLDDEDEEDDDGPVGNRQTTGT